MRLENDSKKITRIIMDVSCLLFSFLTNLIGNEFYAVYILIIITTILVLSTWVVISSRSKLGCIILALTWLCYLCLLGNLTLLILAFSAYYGGIFISCIYLLHRFLSWAADRDIEQIMRRNRLNGHVLPRSCCKTSYKLWWKIY